MKKTVLLLLLFLSLLPISASYYSSNELGQKKSLLSSFSKDGWVLEIEGNGEVLYKDGSEVKRKSTSGLVTKEIEGEREETVVRNENGLIERRIIEAGGRREEYNYFYSGTLLSGYNYSLDSVLVERIEYITTEDGLLLYYSVKDKGVYITESYLVGDDGRKIALSLSPDEGETVTIESGDGGYTEIRGGVEYTYDNNGRLIKEKGGTLIEYSYSSDGILSEKRETKDDGVYVTLYGEMETLSFYSPDGAKISERTTRDDGSIEERRFINGRAEYVFIYDKDGRRLMEAYKL